MITIKLADINEVNQWLHRNKGYSHVSTVTIRGCIYLRARRITGPSTITFTHIESIDSVRAIDKSSSLIRSIRAIVKVVVVLTFILSMVLILVSQ